MTYSQTGLPFLDGDADLKLPAGTWWFVRRFERGRIPGTSARALVFRDLQPPAIEYRLCNRNGLFGSTVGSVSVFPGWSPQDKQIFVSMPSELNPKLVEFLTEILARAAADYEPLCRRYFASLIGEVENGEAVLSATPGQQGAAGVWPAPADLPTLAMLSGLAEEQVQEAVKDLRHRRLIVSPGSSLSDPPAYYRTPAGESGLAGLAKLVCG